MSKLLDRMLVYNYVKAYLICLTSLLSLYVVVDMFTNMDDFTQVKTYVAQLPLMALVIVLAGWLVATVAGTSVAAGIGRSRVPAYIVGALLFVAGIVNAFTIPQPVWFSAVSFVVYIVGTMIGGRIAVPNRRLASM